MIAAMPSADELDACYEGTAERCAEEGYFAVRLQPQPADSGNLTIQVDVTGRQWIIEVDCSWPRSTSLPTVRLVNHDSHLAHVGYNGIVCVNDNQGLSIDSSRQVDTVAETVLAAIALLERSARELYGENYEFYNELEGYWGGLPHGVAGRTYVEVDGRDRVITSYFDRAVRSPTWYFVEPSDTTPPEFAVSKLPAMRALYFALDKAMSPPLPGKELDATYITELLAALSPSQAALWERLVGSSAKTKSRVVALLMSVPRAAGGRSSSAFRSRFGPAVSSLEEESPQ